MLELLIELPRRKGGDTIQQEEEDRGHISSEPAFVSAVELTSLLNTFYCFLLRKHQLITLRTEL